MKEKEYLLATNDATGKTIVIVPDQVHVYTAFDVRVIANKHFKVKSDSLHVCAGIRKGNKVESLDNLNTKGNCWMVWR